MVRTTKNIGGGGGVRSRPNIVVRLGDYQKNTCHTEQFLTKQIIFEGMNNIPPGACGVTSVTPTIKFRYFCCK